jgi:ABC-2 type transport system permease protein
LFPSSLGIHAYVRTNTMGASIDDIAFYHWGLIIQAAIYTILSLIFYYWQLKKRKIEE